MRNKCLVITAFLLATWGISTPCVAQKYKVTKVQRSRILVDKRFDQNPDAQAAVFIAPYKHKVDSIMSPVVGETAHYMAAGRPESELSNLLCDIWYGLVRISKRSLCSPFIIWVVFVQPWLRENKRLVMSMIWLLSRIRYVSLL